MRTNEMDYRKLLKNYIRIVLNAEGVHFIYPGEYLYGNRVTEEENNELCILAEEVINELKIAEKEKK